MFSSYIHIYIIYSTLLYFSRFCCTHFYMTCKACRRGRLYDMFLRNVVRKPTAKTFKMYESIWTTKSNRIQQNMFKNHMQTNMFHIRAPLPEIFGHILVLFSQCLRAPHLLMVEHNHNTGQSGH